MSGLVEAARFGSGVEADVARLTLAAEGIEAVLFDQGMSAAAMGIAIPVRLMVLDEDLAAARAVLG